MCSPVTEEEAGTDQGELSWGKTHNWNDQVSWKPKAKVQPKTVAELQALFRSEEKLRLGGALHSLNESLIADEHTVWVDMKGLNNVERVQTETDGSRPSASTAGHVLIDWVTVYTYTG